MSENEYLEKFNKLLFELPEEFRLIVAELSTRDTHNKVGEYYKHVLRDCSSYVKQFQSAIRLYRDYVADHIDWKVCMDGEFNVSEFKEGNSCLR